MATSFLHSLPSVLRTVVRRVVFVLETPLMYLFGRDIFISYTRTNKIERYQLSDDAPNLIGKGRIDPANPDEISGSATAEHVTVGGVKKTVTITWNLRRCASQ